MTRRPVIRRQPEVAVTEAEIAVRTGELDQLHHDVGMPALRDGVAAWSDEIRTGTGRPHSRISSTRLTGNCRQARS